MKFENFLIQVILQSIICVILRKTKQYTKHLWICVLIIFLLLAKFYALSGFAWCRKLHVSLNPVCTNMALALSRILQCTINPDCRIQWPRGLRRWSATARFLGHWEFQSHRERGCLFLVSVACWQVEVSATGRSLVQRTRTKFGVPECDRGNSCRRLKHTKGCRDIKNSFGIRLKTFNIMLISR